MEEWREIKDYPEYFISNLGNLKHGDKLLKLDIDTKGYLRIKRKFGKIYCHKAVAKAFIENPEQKLEIDHINRNTQDNRVENLRWATRSENLINRDFPLGKLGQKYIDSTPTGKYRLRIRRNYLLVLNKTFDSLSEAITARDTYLQSL